MIIKGDIKTPSDRSEIKRQLQTVKKAIPETDPHAHLAIDIVWREMCVLWSEIDTLRKERAKESVK